MAVLALRTLGFASKQVPAERPAAPALDAAGAAQRLAAAVQFPTVSHQDPAQSASAAFDGLHRYLGEAFPAVHSRLRREVIAEHSLLFTWPGNGPGKPVLLVAHLDTVPIESGTESAWEHPPFSGAIADGFVWGRGTLDDKGSVLGILEAVEGLLQEGFVPARTVYLAFGHDEEVGGERGAVAMAALLGERGIALDYVLDEGGVIASGIVPRFARPVALVGMAEKGYVTVELTVQSPSGHSSMPPHHTAIGVLSAAVARLENQPVPGHLDAALRRTFEYLGPEMPFLERLVLANLWLFGPLLERVLSDVPALNAGMRTTTAVTMFQGGEKENQLPSAARAVVNLRVMPGDTVADVVAHVRRAVDDPQVAVRTLASPSEPSAVSPIEAPTFAVLQRTVREVFPDAVVAPSLVLGGTDARHYASLSPNVYRFVPYRLAADDLHRIHGTNERIAVENYGQIVWFYRQLLHNTAG